MLAMDIPYETAMHLNPNKLKPFIEAYETKRKILDSQMWVMGQYILDAVLVAVEKNLAGKKAKLKYFEKPLLQDIDEKQGKKEISEEEKMQQVKNLFNALEIRKINYDLEKKHSGKDK